MITNVIIMHATNTIIADIVEPNERALLNLTSHSPGGVTTHDDQSSLLVMVRNEASVVLVSTRNEALTELMQQPRLSLSPVI